MSDAIYIAAVGLFCLILGLRAVREVEKEPTAMVVVIYGIGGGLAMLGVLVIGAVKRMS